MAYEPYGGFLLHTSICVSMSDFRPTASLIRSTIVGVIALGLLHVGACDRSGSSNKEADPSPPATKPTANPGPSSASAALAARASGALFTDITGAVGFDQDPPPYPDGSYFTPEITPGAVALFDYDNDGRLDILVVRHPPPTPYPQALSASAPNRLYHQKPDGRFVEIPNAGGLAGKGYHHGVAIGDIDNDGFPDVYICNYGGPDQLFHNNGDGTFTDITAKAGLPTARNDANWSSTAAFVDFDGDGFLDLIVVHFATFDPGRRCQSSTDPADQDYCGPHTFTGQLATLYHNNGDGTFTDVTAKAGIMTPGRGWGIIAADITGRGLPDLFQANDEEPNQLWVNQGAGTFADEAVLRGCAFDAFGSVRANMGVAIGDVYNAGRLDLYVTHISSEVNVLYRNNGDGTYTDATDAAGMGPIDRPFTGWGCGFFDFDNDGNLDLAVANGRVAKGPVRPEARVGRFWNRFAEPNLLFKGDGNGHFIDASAQAGTFAGRLDVHRALAFADLFNRGAVDMVCVSLDNSVRIFRNDAAATSHNHWLQVLPMTGKRDAIGARVTLTAGGRSRLGICLRAYSYLSSNDPRVHFGLGKSDKVDALEVLWPSGTPRRERFNVLGVDRTLVLHQGAGAPLPFQPAVAQR